MLPLDFIDNIAHQLDTELDAFCHALSKEPTVSIRMNDKVSVAELDILKADDETSSRIRLEDVPWTEDGYYLSQRPQFTLDPLMHAGCYYVQDASSMFIEHVLNEYVDTDSIVLDLCAAPGGKATIISQHLGTEGLLVANEVVRQRVFILSENIQKWGNGNAIVTHNQPQQFAKLLPYSFDCMLIDAPCSGEGMFRKDPQAIEEWSMQNVERCAARQKEIVKDAWGALKPGGILIYSTCTFNHQENEDVVKYITEQLGADILPVYTEPEWGITGHVGYHFYPHKVQGEGLYVCVMRKREVPYLAPRHRSDKKKSNSQGENLSMLKQWLRHPDYWAYKQTERFTTAYPARHKELIDYITSCFTCISYGFGLSELRGRGHAPQHSLSMLKDFNKEMFTAVDLDRATAIQYLRTESLIIEDIPLGLVLLTYRGIPLGFAKNIGSHCNNLYPNEWRIRKLTIDNSYPSLRSERSLRVDN